MEVFNTKENMVFIFEKSPAAAWLTGEVAYNSAEAKDGGSLNKSMEIAVEWVRIELGREWVWAMTEKEQLG